MSAQTYAERFDVLRRFARLLSGRLSRHHWLDAVRAANIVFCKPPLQDCDVQRLCDELRPHETATESLAVLPEGSRSLEDFSNQADFVGWLRTLRS